MVFLNRIELSNIYSFQKAAVDFQKAPSVIVGPNNSGKSNIFRAIDLMVNTLVNRNELTQSSVFKSASSAGITLKLDLSESEANTVLNLLCVYRTSQGVVNSYVLPNKSFMISKFDKITLTIEWKENVRSGSLPFMVSITIEKLNLIINESKEKDLEFSLKGRIYPFSLSFLQYLGKIDSIEKLEEYVADVNADDIIFPGRIVFNQLLEPRIPIDQEIIRDILSLASGQRGSNDEINLPWLLGLILRRSICFTSERSKISDAELKYDNILKPDGSNVTSFLFSLKISEDPTNRKRFLEIQKIFREVFNDLNLDVISNFSYQNDIKENKESVKTSIVVFDERINKQFSLDQVGSGVSEIIFLLSASLGSRNSVVLLDEPAVNLHRDQLKQVMKKIIPKTIGGISQNQFIVITHSEALLHYLLFQQDADIYYVNRSNKNESRINFLFGESKEWFKLYKNKLSYTIDMRIFFSSLVVLVEGESDYIVLNEASQHFRLQFEDLELESKNVSIIDIDGKENFQKYEQMINSFKIRGILIGDYGVTEDRSTTRIFNGYSTISATNISGSNSKRYVIKFRDINMLLMEIDHELYHEALKEIQSEFHGRADNKPLIARRFMEKIVKNDDPDTKLGVFRDLLQRIISYNHYDH